MTLQQAVEKSLQGRWAKYSGKLDEETKKTVSEMILKNKNNDYAYPHTFLLTPDFWECLGRTMGWPPDHNNARCGTWKDEVTMEHCWLCWWRNMFIVHLANGGTIETFFEHI